MLLLYVIKCLSGIELEEFADFGSPNKNVVRVGLRTGGLIHRVSVSPLLPAAPVQSSSSAAESARPDLHWPVLDGGYHEWGGLHSDNF